MGFLTLKKSISLWGIKDIWVSIKSIIYIMLGSQLRILTTRLASPYRGHRVQICWSFSSNQIPQCIGVYSVVHPAFSGPIFLYGYQARLGMYSNGSYNIGLVRTCRNSFLFIHLHMNLRAPVNRDILIMLLEICRLQLSLSSIVTTRTFMDSKKGI